MFIPERDRQVLQLLADFKQVTAKQLHDIVFLGVASRTPCARTLQRLQKQGLLYRIEHRLIGGAAGGSGQYAYVLTTAGLRLCGLDGRSGTTRVVYHTLAIVDALAAITRSGAEIVSRQGEPDCWRRIGIHEVRPDMALEVVRPSGVEPIWFEVDLGTESQRHIKSKLSAYIKAWSSPEASKLDKFPLVLWVTVDEARAKALEGIIRRESEADQALFRVTTMDRLVAIFSVPQ